MKRFEVTYRIEHHEQFGHADSQHTILVLDDHDFRAAIMHHALERKYGYKLTYDQVAGALEHDQDEYGEIAVGDEIVYVWSNHDSLGFCIGWEGWGPERTDPACFINLVAINNPGREATKSRQEAISPKGGAVEKNTMPPEGYQSRPSATATLIRPDLQAAFAANAVAEAERALDRETGIINERYPGHSRVTRVAKGTYRINKVAPWGDGLVQTNKIVDSKLVKVVGDEVVVLS